MERFTISLDDRLAHEFSDWIEGRGYDNRSEAVRDLIRAELERTRQDAPSPDLYCVACLSYVYNHHERELGERLTARHHAHHDLTLSTMHAHLDHEHCLETVILRGPATEVRRFADALCAERGVHHGRLNLISVEAHGDHRKPAGRRGHPEDRADAGAHAHGHGPKSGHLHLRPTD